MPPRDVSFHISVNVKCIRYSAIYCLLSPVTVQCTRDGQFVVVVARDATLPPTDVNSISLLRTDEVFCSPVDSTSAFAIFQFPVTACGTTVTVGGRLS